MGIVRYTSNIGSCLTRAFQPESHQGALQDMKRQMGGAVTSIGEEANELVERAGEDAGPVTESRPRP